MVGTRQSAELGGVAVLRSEASLQGNGVLLLAGWAPGLIFHLSEKFCRPPNIIFNAFLFCSNQLSLIL